MSLHQPADTNLQQVAYDALVGFFLSHEDDVMEIEILPPAIEPSDGIVLHEGLNLGIPKKILALAFIEARHRFSENAINNRTPSIVLMATKVILLFDPEHITAANFRKRRLLALKEAVPTEETIYRTALKRELCFLNSILTSPLHRQSKSPTLWHHRLWTVNLFMDSELGNASEEQRTAFWRSEIDAVCKSGERHPKNYYAWQYARRLMPEVEVLGVNDEFAHRVKDWCFKHPSDISGWSFLLFQLSGVCLLSKRQIIIREVLNYAINLRAEQESLWVFIRMALSQDELFGNRVENYQTLRNYGNEINENTNHQVLSARVSQTLHWMNTFGDPFSTDEATHST